MENFFTLSPLEYIKATKDADMTKQYRFFEPFLIKGSTILDIGFGSARDMLYFKNLGYDVTGIEIEEEFIEKATGLGLKAKLTDLMKYNPKEKYDAIWACASLMYFTMEELPDVFKKIKSLLKPNGVAYCSFKYGDWEGYIAEKYYTYLTEEKIKKLNLNPIAIDINKDSLNRSHSWISFIIKND